MTGTAELVAELSRLAQSAVVELYELDLTSVATELPPGQDLVVRFHAGLGAEIGRVVSFGGNVYHPYPLRVTGFEFNSEGAPPRPSLSISNIGGWFTSLLLATDDLVGARVTRRRTLVRYLDFMPDAAPCELDPDHFYVTRKVSESRAVVELELGSALDLDGVMFPRRTVVADYCSWRYRGRGCGFNEERFVGFELGMRGGAYLRYRGPYDDSQRYSKVDGQGDCVTIMGPDGYRSIYSCTLAAPSYVTGSAGHPLVATSDWVRVQRIRGVYDATVTDYVIGDVVWEEHLLGSELLRVYAIAVRVNGSAVPAGARPLHANYWLRDMCNKRLAACGARWDPVGAGRTLPYGGFPGTANLPRST